MYVAASLARLGLRYALAALGVVLVFSLGPPGAVAATTINVDETGESASFVNGGDKPLNYFDRIDDLSNHNDKCSLREAIEASNTDTSVDGCPAGDGPGDVIDLPAGDYSVYDNLFVRQPVTIRGANAGRAGNSPDRGPESKITFVYNPHSQAQVGMFWLGNPGPSGPADGGGSIFDGLELVGNSNPLCQATSPAVIGTCEEWAIVQPEKSGGGPDAAPGLQLRNSIVRDFSSGVYVGGRSAVIARNLFKDNDALLGDPRGVNSGVDVYADAVYTSLDPVVVRNVFANPAVAAIEYQGYTSAEDVSGGLIRGNLFNLPSRGRWAILLLNTHGLRILDNVMRDASPPADVTTRTVYGMFLDGVQDLEISGNTLTGLGTAFRVSNLGVGFRFGGVTDVRVANNRIYDNRYGFRIRLPYEPLAIDARANWWGANGGAGSNGARPGAANPVNGVLFENGPAPNPGAVDTSGPLQLECSMPTNVTVNTPVPLTGRVAGMPAVDRTAATAPWFTGIHVPLMDGGVSGVAGNVFDFGVPPSNGVRGGQVIADGGSLTGKLVATATGAGSGDVALDSEQVGCPFQSKAEDIVIDKTTHTRFARPGARVTYRITVKNRGAAPVRRLRVCDRMPRALKFLRATPHMHRVAGRRLCATIRILRPGHRRTFHATFRVRANVTADSITNGADAETDNGPSNGNGTGSTKGNRRRHARDGATIGIKHTVVRGCPARVTVRAHAAC